MSHILKLTRYHNKHNKQQNKMKGSNEKSMSEEVTL